MHPAPPIPQDDIVEVRLSDIFSFFRKYWLVLFLAGLLSGGVGYGLAWLVKPEFESTANILPEYGTGISGTGSLSDLASLAGISIGKNNSEAIRPDLYPSILASKPFVLKLFSTPLPLSNGKKVNLISYLDENAKPLTAQQIAQGDTLIVLSKEQERIMKGVSKRITATFDKMTGVLTVKAVMPDPTLAAACATFSLSYLRSFVTEYRGGKKVEKVAFLQKQMAEAKGKYRNAEMTLNAYRDRNRNAYTNVAKVEEQRLQGDFLQAQSLYGELARQLEAARLLALEDTPVLKVLDPPMVPNIRSSPKRSLYALGFAIFGGFVTLLFLLFRKEKIQERFS
ncbi:lipopolysaccharide biosynthesis protein [Persicitalea sp.]|uniref:lipopolysaccharide biosynthesis protein n=1 Tax=Persicitalea sp. TaxID=3100273 RepID=UPI0035943B63